jgi:hypothetical protein
MLHYKSTVRITGKEAEMAFTEAELYEVGLKEVRKRYLNLVPGHMWIQERHAMGTSDRVNWVDRLEEASGNDEEASAVAIQQRLKEELGIDTEIAEVCSSGDLLRWVICREETPLIEV